MRSFVCVLVLLMVLLAQAQELDTTYVIDEQGRTIGLIHEKGAIPRIMPVAAPAPVTESAPVASVNGVDSSAYYQDLVKRYTLSGEKKRGAGNGMMVGGSVGFLLGVLMMVHAEESTDRCGNNDYGCNDDEFLEFITGYGVAIAGGIVFGVGIGLKIAGGAKLRRAERYQDALNRYNARKLQTLKLQVEPIINARKGAFGSRLSLNF